MLTLYFLRYAESRGWFAWSPWFHQPSGLRLSVDRGCEVSLHRYVKSDPDQATGWVRVLFAG